MRIAEIFRSLQGEGRLTGVESLFVRVSGCNLRCRWCDTPYASWSPEGEDLSVTEILDRINDLRDAPPPALLKKASPLPWGEGADVRHVVLTGGEPMLFAELIPLCDALRSAGWHITIETSGTLYLPVACHLMSISPKLSNSTPPAEGDPQWTWRHTLQRHAPEVIRRLTTEYDYQLKFVVDRPEDFLEIEEYLAEFPAIARDRVWLMPQGVDAAALARRIPWIESYCAERGFHICHRRQVEWVGAARGT